MRVKDQFNADNLYNRVGIFFNVLLICWDVEENNNVK